MRKSRASTRDLEADREKLTARVKALEAQLLDTEEQLGKRGAEAISQVRCIGWLGLMALDIQRAGLQEAVSRAPFLVSVAQPFAVNCVVEAWPVVFLIETRQHCQ